MFVIVFILFFLLFFFIFFFGFHYRFLLLFTLLTKGFTHNTLSHARTHTQDGMMQTYVGMWIIGLSLIATVLSKPFEHQLVQKLECFSLSCLLVTLNLSMMFFWDLSPWVSSTIKYHTHSHSRARAHDAHDAHTLSHTHTTHTIASFILSHCATIENVGNIAQTQHPTNHNATHQPTQSFNLNPNFNTSAHAFDPPSHIKSKSRVYYLTFSLTPQLLLLVSILLIIILIGAVYVFINYIIRETINKVVGIVLDPEPQHPIVEQLRSSVRNKFLNYFDNQIVKKKLMEEMAQEVKDVCCCYHVIILLFEI